MAKKTNKNLYQFLDIFTNEILETTSADSIVIYKLNNKRGLLSIRMVKSVCILPPFVKTIFKKSLLHLQPVTLRNIFKLF